MRETIRNYVKAQDPLYRQIALELHARPETCNQEFFACQRLSDQLRAEGFEVQVDIAGHSTGFIGTYKSARPGPVLVFMAEYDALPGLGHGCGHNLFGPASLLAGAALRQVIDRCGGEVRVYGTPGEEGGPNGAAKASYVRAGLFSDVDAALCVHPHSKDCATAMSLGCAPVEIEFRGKSAHAANAPEQGVNALDAVILTYNGINALRQHVTEDVRIHGIITHGGMAPNIVPDYAAASFFLRASAAPTLKELYRKVEDIVAGAAAMTGAKGSMRPSQNMVENTVVTRSFDAVFEKELNALGRRLVYSDSKVGIGSTDAGNVSQVVPTIQPTLSITDVPTPWHSEASKAAACSEKGLAFISLAAQCMALTALDLIEDPALLEKIKKDHAAAVAAQR